MYATDEEIITGIKTGKDQALSALYKMHFGMINYFIIQNNGTEQEAKDIYQEAIIHFYEKINDNAFVLQCKIKTYLYAVCRKLWLKKLAQKKKFVVNVVDIEKFIPVEIDLEEHENKENDYLIMQTAMIELGEPCSTLIQDYYWQEMSMETIAEKFGYTNADNAKNQKYKCLQRLKKYFFSKYTTE